MKKFKKALAVLLVLCMVLSLAGCSGDDDKKNVNAPTNAADKKDSDKKTDDTKTTKDDDKKTTADDDKDVNVDEPDDSDNDGDDEIEPDDEVVETKTFANGVYINEDGIYCNADGTTVDLGGMEIWLGDWFSKDETPEPVTAYEEATAEYRDYIQETYNFTIKNHKLSGYGTYLENFTNFATSGGDENYVFCMDNAMVTTPMLSGLFADLNQIDILDFTEEKWDSSVGYLTTQGSATYGMRADATEPRGGVLFNKRLFEEAGIDPELPYDLQAKNEWTWDTFEDICKQLTRDTDNDGANDCWAMTSFKGDLMNAAIASNGAQLIDIDDNGKFYLASNSDKFMEAYDWIGYMRQNYEMPSLEGEDGDNWDYAYGAFERAEAAMIVCEEYMVGTYNETMADDFGFVMFPRGPKVDELTGYSRDNIYAIPSCYDADRTWKIAFAYNLYTEPTPDYEDADDWKMNYYPIFRDERAVDETLELMRTHQDALIYRVIPKVNTDNEYYYNIDSETAAERYEIKKDEYQSYIDAIQAP